MIYSVKPYRKRWMNAWYVVSDNNMYLHKDGTWHETTGIPFKAYAYVLKRPGFFNSKRWAISVLKNSKMFKNDKDREITSE